MQTTYSESLGTAQFHSLFESNRIFSLDSRVGATSASGLVGTPFILEVGQVGPANLFANRDKDLGASPCNRSLGADRLLLLCRIRRGHGSRAKGILGSFEELVAGGIVGEPSGRVVLDFGHLGELQRPQWWRLSRYLKLVNGFRRCSRAKTRDVGVLAALNSKLRLLVEVGKKAGKARP